MASVIEIEPLPASPRSVRTIADLVTSSLSTAGDTPISAVVRLFEAHPDVDGLAVLDDPRIRFLSRPRFLLQLGRRFGYALFENRPVSLLAEEGSTIDAGADPVEVIALATQREPGRIYDDILVLEGGRYLGLVSMRSLLAHHKSLLVASMAELAMIEEKNRKAEELHRIQTEFMANMTHELRSPLNVVLGVVQILAADPTLAERHRRHVELLLARGRDLQGVVNNILDVSKLEAGAMTPLVEEVDVRALVADVIASTEPLLVGKRVQLHPVSCDHLPKTFPTDPVFLHRILTNLLSNAVKFTEMGSITLVADSEPGVLVLRVADTGVGIQEADLKRLFVRFGQLESTKTKRHSGTGLGLAIVKGLVDALGGAITVDSRVGLGTRFVVRLPRGRASLLEEAKRA